MKKMLLLLFTLSLLAIGTKEVFANVYATGLKVTNPDGSVFDGKFNDGTGAKIWFRLNEPADTVKISVKLNSSVIRDTTILNAPFGQNAWTWNGKNNQGSVVGVGNYSFSIYCAGAGHSKWDSLWSAGSDLGGIDFLGATTFSYRGICLNRNMNSKLFGEAYVAYSTGWTSEAVQKHLFVVLNSDSTVARKISENFPWNATGINEQPNDSAYRLVQPWYCELGQDNKLYASAQGRGEIAVFNPETGDNITSEAAPTQDIRGFSVFIKGTDTIFYWAQGTTGGVVKKKVGLAGTATDFYVPAGTQNYMRDVAVDDDGNVYAAHSAGTNATTANRRLVKIAPSGTILWTRDTTNISPTGTEGGIRAICVSRGKNLQSAADDRVFILCANSSGTSVNRHGIFEVTPSNGDTKRVIRFAFNSVGSVSFDISCDAAGNLYMSNGSDSRTVTAYSPSDGYNNFTTDAPAGVAINVLTAVNERAEVPGKYILEQNYPNPFNPNTVIKYNLAKTGLVNIKVYNLLGCEVASLVNEIQNAGSHQVTFDCKGLSSGVYFYKITSGNFTDMKKMILQK